MSWYTSPSGVAHWADEDDTSGSMPFTACDLHVDRWRNGNAEADSACAECEAHLERRAETTYYS